LKNYKISIIGLGYVGLTLAVVNSKKGKTIGIEIDTEKLENLKKGKTNFYEPKLEKMLKSALKTKRLILTSKIESILETEITFLTVGTPSTNKGKIDLLQLKKVIKKLSKILKQKKGNHLIIIKSSVIPTTTKNIFIPILKNIKNVEIVVNPEFLREGNAINDILEPHLIVIGQSNNNKTELEKYYNWFYKKCPEIIRTDITSAEMIKYANNAFLATKISFINAIANICQNLPSVDVNKIAYAIGKDSRIGPQFLNAGPGFGGSCLPKDLLALIDFSKKHKQVNEFFKSVKYVNESQPLKVIDLVKNLHVLKPKKTISILGLSFKKDTDDIREAVSVKIVNQLLKKKIKVKVHDPMAMNNFKKIFSNKIVYCKTIENCLLDSDCCIILTEWNDYRVLTPSKFKKNMKNANIIDARRILDPLKFRDLNFKAIGLGVKEK